MAEKDYHLARAKHNLEAASFLKDTEYLDWAMTSLFYSALHLVDAFFAGETQLIKDEQHPRKHSANNSSGNGGRGRNQLVRALLPEIKKQYSSLEEASRRSRYDAKRLAEDFDVNTYTLLLFQHREIENHVKQRIKEQAEKRTLYT